MGEFNIDLNSSGPGKKKLDKMSNLFDLTNLVKEASCCANNDRSTVGLIITSKTKTS